ncbi:Receptor-like protein kinase FERONIA [Vitis vinifera]|uniref:Receptor-like protein kinase FERONIA n=1 Tax=Vitis vinifera TaxID=29760 RepID=A0A438IMW5_VITVI|nr:Receptor-like protein kinase FERONIA [Vitis vinifera]
MKYRRQHKSLFCISILSPFYFLLLQCFSTVTASNYAATYNPTDNIALDCGSSGNSTASDGRAWTGDIGSILATLQPLDTTIAARAIRQGPVEGIPYLTARMSSSQFTYTFLVSAGLKFVRLYFYPSWYPGFDRSKALFSVKSGPFTLLSNFRADLVADSLGLEYFVREFCINVEEISADGIPFIGQTYFYEIENITALETMYRLDVGGHSISPTGDSGMFRFWSDDNQFFMGGGVIPDKANSTIKYTKETPAYIAPAEVYQTSRSMGPNKTWNMRNNLTWVLPVDLGFRYLVRLHLCETNRAITQVSDRQFIIYIDGEMVDEAADAIIWSGGNSIPAYRDYLAMIGFEGTQGKYNLSIDLHSRAGFSVYVDAVLNGIEIFKLNSTTGSLAGPNPEPPKTIFLTEPSQLTIKGSSNKKTTFIAVGVIVTVGLVLLSLRLYTMFRLQRESKDHGYKLKFTETKASLLPWEVCHQFSKAETKEVTHV